MRFTDLSQMRVSSQRLICNTYNCFAFTRNKEFYTRIKYLAFYCHLSYTVSVLIAQKMSMTLKRESDLSLIVRISC